MNLYKLDVRNKNTNLYGRFYILFIRNQRKNWLPNKYRFPPFSSVGTGQEWVACGVVDRPLRWKRAFGYGRRAQTRCGLCGPVAWCPGVAGNVAALPCWSRNRPESEREDRTLCVSGRTTHLPETRLCSLRHVTSFNCALTLLQLLRKLKSN
jgi:hypothetical protein